MKHLCILWNEFRKKLKMPFITKRMTTNPLFLSKFLNLSMQITNGQLTFLGDL